MSKIDKLLDRLRFGRRLSFAELERLVLAFGFRLDRTVGSHHIYYRPDVPERVNIQPDGKDAKAYQVRQFVRMIDRYGLTLDEDDR